MSEIAHHLVRRAVDVTNQHYAQASSAGEQDGEPKIKQIATWGVVLLWMTGVLYMALASAVSPYLFSTVRSVNLT